MGERAGGRGGSERVRMGGRGEVKEEEYVHELKFRGRRHVYMWVDVEGMRGVHGREE